MIVDPKHLAQYDQYSFDQLLQLISRKYKLSRAEIKALIIRGQQVHERFSKKYNLPHYSTLDRLPESQQEDYAAMTYEYYAQEGMGAYENGHVKLNDLGVMMFALVALKMQEKIEQNKTRGR